jgi:outer membrane protein assembly factor BamD
MNMKTTLLLALLSSFIFFSGCSKDIEEYNKPAVYWYAKIVESISDGNLDKADNYYSSLQGEHIGSPLLPEATMILATAHMHYEEYLLTEHFLNEYVKRYANSNEKEFAEFLKIKAKYMALPNPRRDQVLINEAIVEAQAFKRNYPTSMYYAIVDTMATNLYMAEAALNESIASLYDRVDKPRGAHYYRAMEQQPWIVWDEVNRANTPWYKEWFEGDGTSSWYEFMIPDTQSVVSRNSVKNDEELLEENTQIQQQGN